LSATGEPASVAPLAQRRALMRAAHAHGEAIAVAIPALLAFGLMLYRISVVPTLVGDAYDEGGYYLMSRNMWLHGTPLLDQGGSGVWSTTWSPALSFVLSPLAGLGLNAGVVAERVAVALCAVAWITISYVWMRRTVGLTTRWAAVACACLATLPQLAWLGSSILSDVPAATALWAGIVLVRAGRTGRGAAAFALAAAFRVVDIALVAVIPVWLFLSGRRRASLAAAAIGCCCAGAWGLFWLLHGTTGYLTQLRRRNPTDPSSGTIALSELPHRALTSLRHVALESPGFPAGIFDSAHLRAHAYPLLAVLSVALLVCAAAGIWKRRLILEALVALVTLAVVSIWPADPARFVLPLAPLVIGAAAVALAESPGRFARPLAAAAAAVVLAGNLHEYWAVTPSRASSRQRVADVRAAYAWLRHHAPRGATVITPNDVQTFLYSTHPATSSEAAFRPGRTYVVGFVAAATAASKEPGFALLRRFEGKIVFHNDSATILRARRRAP
jgi:hypothetical protein